MPFAFTIAAIIPASPKDIYDAWLDGTQHARMTGTVSAKGSTEVGGAHEAWNGYISGSNLVLSPGQRIVQSWRTTEFTEADADSQIDVKLDKTPQGTRLTLIHSNVPDTHTGYETGWVDHYFAPMQAYFAAQAKAKPVAKAKSATKTKAAGKTKPVAKKAKTAAKASKAKAKAAKKPIAKAAPKKTAQKAPAKKKATKKKATTKKTAKKRAKR